MSMFWLTARADVAQFCRAASSGMAARSGVFGLLVLNLVTEGQQVRLTFLFAGSYSYAACWRSSATSRPSKQGAAKFAKCSLSPAAAPSVDGALAWRPSRRARHRQLRQYVFVGRECAGCCGKFDDCDIRPGRWRRVREQRP
jgi:flavin reductase (DIM6/NTAB) family NADH-FMN oxidoreductase RutF